MAATTRGAARLGDEERRINRAIADRIRQADVEAAAAAPPPAEPRNVPDLDAAPEDVANIRERLRRIADEPPREAAADGGSLYPSRNSWGPGNYTREAANLSAPGGGATMGFVGGPRPRDSGLRREPLQDDGATPGTEPAARPVHPVRADDRLQRSLRVREG